MIFFFFTKIRLGVLPFDILPRLLPHTKRRDVRYLSDRSSIVIALIGTIFFTSSGIVTLVAKIYINEALQF